MPIVNPAGFAPADNTLLTQLAASTGSGLVGFIQSGTGAVARTVQDKNRDIVNVKDNGAAVDGVTDDASVINQIITNHQVVNLGRGTSKLTSSLLPKLGTNLIGNPQDKLTATTAEASILYSSALKAIDLSNSGVGNAVLKGFEIRPVTNLVAGSYGIYSSNLAYFNSEEIVISNYDTGAYFDKSQQYTLSRWRITGCNAGLKFAATAGTVNINWFNNDIILDNCIVAGSVNSPNLDWQGIALTARACDFTGIPTSGTRAAVRVRAGSYNATFYDTYVETQAGHAAGGNFFQIEGGVVGITSAFAQGGPDAAHEVGNFISASGGAIVTVDRVTGFNYYTNLITADGAGTVVYVSPGCFSGNLVVSGARYVETNGGKVIELGVWNDVAFDAANFTGGGALTWTLDVSGDQVHFSYFIVGKTMTVTFYIQNSTTGGVANAVLNIKIPAGKTVATRASALIKYNEAGTEGTGFCDALVGSTNIRLTKTLNFGTTWSNASTNQLNIAGSISFGVTT